MTPVVQLNDTLRAMALASVTVTVVEEVPAVVGVPVIAPVEALIDRPVGRPLVDQVYGMVPPLAELAKVSATLLGLT